jgi:hypothetical protein
MDGAADRVFSSVSACGPAKGALSQPRVLVEILYRRILIQEKFAWFTRKDRFAASE